MLATATVKAARERDTKEARRLATLIDIDAEDCMEITRLAKNKIRETNLRIMLERETADDEDEELWRRKQRKRQTLSAINRSIGASDSPLANFAHDGKWISSERQAAEKVAGHWNQVFETKYFSDEDIEARKRYPGHCTQN